VSTVAAPLTRISENLFSFADTCNVYVVRRGREGVAIDWGDGDVLGQLDALGIDRITDVLVTHHHRDQVQGLARAVAAGIRIWVPPVERELFDRVEDHWQMRELYRNYNVRQDRFSLLAPVPITGTVAEYRTRSYGSLSALAVPTPGHTVGSVSILADVDGRRVAFTGDLIHSPGKVWSLAATQWTYNGGEGLAASVLSLLDLKERRPARLLPSHGVPMEDPAGAIDLLVDRLQDLLRVRSHNLRLLELRDHPYDELLPHLLMNRTSLAYSYVLISKSGKALVIDYGYDFNIGQATGVERASRRPWLYTVPLLKRDFGVTSIDVAIATHYHDDHLAGFAMLHDIEGTKIWAAANYAAILRDPARYDLPCLWYDAIPVDRELALDVPFRWEEYELSLHELSGHTLYAVAISFTVDGKRVLAVGDQHGDEDLFNWIVRNQATLAGGILSTPPPPRLLNYIYRNRYRLGDYARTAELYRRLAPDLLIFGHSRPAWDPATTFIAELADRSAELERLHQELLPLDDVDLDAEGALAWVQPYQADVVRGGFVDVDVEVRSPFDRESTAVVRAVTPDGWRVVPESVRLALPRGLSAHCGFRVWAGGVSVRRARVGVDVTVDGIRFGQVAEALITVR
jgi:glyoxylase-like metal-dependent hydrolase (beta-lactamase superfamily II)